MQENGMYNAQSTYNYNNIYVVSCSPQSLDWTGRLDWWT